MTSHWTLSRIHVLINFRQCRRRERWLQRVIISSSLSSQVPFDTKSFKLNHSLHLTVNSFCLMDHGAINWKWFAPKQLCQLSSCGDNSNLLYFACNMMESDKSEKRERERDFQLKHFAVTSQLIRSFAATSIQWHRPLLHPSSLQLSNCTLGFGRL